MAASVSLGHWKDWVYSVVPHLSGPKVLELGHGPGHLLQRLSENEILAFGIDESPTMGIIASNRLQRKKGNSLLIRGYAQYEPFPTNTFHQIVATFPSEFITDPKTLDEAFRVLLPGGKLIILPFIRINGKGFIERAVSWLFRLTDQSPKWSDRFLIPFTKAGFKPSCLPIIGKNWTAFIIIAEKPPSFTLPSTEK